MRDPRMEKLADVLVGYSTHIEPGERVLIEAYDVPVDMVSVLIERVVKAGGVPFVETRQNRVLRTLLRNAGEEQMKIIGEVEASRMNQMKAYIGVRGSDNVTELADVPEDKMNLYEKLWWEPVHGEIRVNKTKWVVLRWPTSSMAQLAGMSTEEFENFYFDVCTLDYAKMAAAEEPLKAWMEKTDRVRLVGPGETDLSFSIKDIPAVLCKGDRNIPDGEVFTAPVRDSVNGVIAFNAPTIYEGQPFDSIRFVFENGRITEATANDTEAVNTILDRDEGARYIGEFSIGFNPFITRPMRDILFDEKIAGSIHFTPGRAYEEADNGNHSQIHWDLVLIQTPEYGGGEIYFDDQLIRKDGRFIPEDLQGLNPENLKS